MHQITCTFSKIFGADTRTPFWCGDPEPGSLTSKIMAAHLVDLQICLFVCWCLCTCPSLCIVCNQFICQQFICLAIVSVMYIDLYLSVGMYIILSVFPSVYVSIHLSVCLAGRISICLCLYDRQTDRQIDTLTEQTDKQ